MFYATLTKFAHNRRFYRYVLAALMRLLSEIVMRKTQILVPLGALMAASVFFVTLIMYSPMSANAGGLIGPVAPSLAAPLTLPTLPSAPPNPALPDQSAQDIHSPKPPKNQPGTALNWPEAKVVIARPRLDLSDEVATLKALQRALDEVGDGSVYVWHRRNGRLSGIIKPTMSFRDGKGKVCRHVEVWLTAGSASKKTESIACRLPDRVWAFEG